LGDHLFLRFVSWFFVSGDAASDNGDFSHVFYLETGLVNVFHITLARRRES
jgi:hypothetical protein